MKTVNLMVRGAEYEPMDWIQPAQNRTPVVGSNGNSNEPSGCTGTTSKRRSEEQKNATRVLNIYKISFN
jgi:hypothetical protein